VRIVRLSSVCLVASCFFWYLVLLIGGPIEVYVMGKDTEFADRTKEYVSRRDRRRDR